MKVTPITPLAIAAAVLALLVTGCGKNYDAESREELSITLNAGTVLEVMPLTDLSPVTEEAGDEFSATLAAPLLHEGRTIAPQGTTVVGQVVDAKSAGPGEPGSFLALELQEIHVSGGEPIEIKTETVRYAPAEEGEQVEGIPAPAVVPEDTRVSFRLSEPVEVKVAIDQNETEPAPIS